MEYKTEYVGNCSGLVDILFRLRGHTSNESDAMGKLISDSTSGQDPNGGTTLVWV